MSGAIKLSSREIIGQGSGPHLLITGGVHGDEFEPMAAVRRLIREFDASKLRGQVTLVPVVNEPAYLRGGRTAEDGIDLARVCPGRGDGSITERIAHALSELIRSADFYIDLHTGGTMMSVLPLAGYGMHVNGDVLDQQRRMARAMNLPVVWGTCGTQDGRSLSVARDAGVPAIYAEYDGGGRCTRAGVEAYVAGCLNVAGELGMIDREPPLPAVLHFVEDSRPNSGHMQVQNGSPMTGFFEPAVCLGDPIRVGEPIGTACDILGTRVETIESAQDGIVLVLRTFSRVRQGESVGVILESPV